MLERMRTQPRTQAALSVANMSHWARRCLQQTLRRPARAAEEKEENYNMNDWPSRILVNGRDLGDHNEIKIENENGL